MSRELAQVLDTDRTESAEDETGGAGWAIACRKKFVSMGCLWWH
jgi:hypothetical protein